MSKKQTLRVVKKPFNWEDEEPDLDVAWFVVDESEKVVGGPCASLDEALSLKDYILKDY